MKAVVQHKQHRGWAFLFNRISYPLLVATNHARWATRFAKWVLVRAYPKLVDFEVDLKTPRERWFTNGVITTSEAWKAGFRARAAEAYPESIDDLPKPAMPPPKETTVVLGKDWYHQLQVAQRNAHTLYYISDPRAPKRVGFLDETRNVLVYVPLNQVLSCIPEAASLFGVPMADFRELVVEHMSTFVSSFGPGKSAADIIAESTGGVADSEIPDVVEWPCDDDMSPEALHQAFPDAFPG